MPGPLRGNLLAALAEGVFLLGCERNADTVQMVSYAPLLGHVEGRTALTGAPPPWHAMIYFDGTRVFGTASYYLWKLFGTNRPDQMVQADVEFRERQAADHRRANRRRHVGGDRPSSRTSAWRRTGRCCTNRISRKNDRRLAAGGRPATRREPIVAASKTARTAKLATVRR